MTPVTLAVSFWCQALDVPWRWSYTPYLGAWAIVIGLLAGYALLLRRHPAPPEGTPARRLRRRRVAQFVAGALVLGAASDWPLAPLGAGYLLSVAVLRFLLVTMVAMPLLLLGTPPTALRSWLVDRPRVHRIARRLLSWPVALLVFNTVLVVTHLPAVVDTIKPYQLGSFALDASWLVAGIALWWPVLSPLEELPPIRDPMRMGYLFAQSVIPTIPSSFLVFAQMPLFATYELAPPLWLSFDTITDQQTAGLLMKIGGGFLLWGVIAVAFFRWAAREERGDVRPDDVPWDDFERALERHDLRA